MCVRVFHIGVIDLSPLYEVLLKEVCSEFSDDHIVTHPCGHWVLRRLLEATVDEETTPSQSGMKLSTANFESLIYKLVIRILIAK